MKKIEDLKPNEAIHCKTLEEVRAICKKASAEGIERPFTPEEAWSEHNDRLYIKLSDMTGMAWGKIRKRLYTYYPASDFLPVQPQPVVGREMKPLEQITDEHAIGVAKLVDNGFIGKKLTTVIKKFGSPNMYTINTNECDDVSVVVVYIDKNELRRVMRHHEDSGEITLPTSIRVVDYLRQFYHIDSVLPPQFRDPNAYSVPASGEVKKWDVLNKKFDDALDSMTKEDWDRFEQRCIEKGLKKTPPSGLGEAKEVDFIEELEIFITQEPELDSIDTRFVFKWLEARQGNKLISTSSASNGVDVDLEDIYDKVSAIISEDVNNSVRKGKIIKLILSLHNEGGKDNWISVEERLPDYGIDCIIWDENKGMPLIASYDHMQRMWRDNFQDMYEGVPTHWKPLNIIAPPYTSPQTNK